MLNAKYASSAYVQPLGINFLYSAHNCFLPTKIVISSNDTKSFCPWIRTQAALLQIIASGFMWNTRSFRFLSRDGSPWIRTGAALLQISVGEFIWKISGCFFICSELKFDNLTWNWPTVKIVKPGTIPFNYAPQTILVTAHNKLQNNEKYREICVKRDLGITATCL